jgi:uncharacterized protein YprB with RNaseH-like and TPR domain
VTNVTHKGGHLSTKKPTKPTRHAKVPMRFAILDLETTALHANGGRILCAVVESFDPPATRIFRADQYPGWDQGKRFSDKLLFKELRDHLEEFDVLVAHNGIRFDLPFIQSKALRYKMKPLNPGIKFIDPVMLARKYLRLNSNRLDTVARHIHSKHQKTPLDMEVWFKAIGDGDRHCLNKIVSHCVADVKVLGEVMEAVRPFVKQIDSLGSWR